MTNNWDDILSKRAHQNLTQKRTVSRPKPRSRSRRDSVAEKNPRVQRAVQQSRSFVSNGDKIASDVEQQIQSARAEIQASLQKLQSLKRYVGFDTRVRLMERALGSALAALRRQPNLSINEENIRQALLKNFSPQEVEEAIKEIRRGR